MEKKEMAKAYAEGFAKEYREIAYDAFLCGYDAKCSTETPKDLEEAAKDYRETEIANGHFFKIKGTKPLCYLDDLTPAFIAGAKWQKEQMMDEWLKDRDGCFWDGVEEGKKAMREQMMKEAVEGWVSSTKGDHFGCVTSVPTDLGKLYGADKCKIIIVKED